MPINTYEKAITALTGLGPIRVWSVLVTVFGDLAHETSLDGSTLSAIMAEIGIKPEATRVALYRLRSDGWVRSEKTGRTSRYNLTDKGAHDSAAANPRIYGPPNQMGLEAQVILLPIVGIDIDPARYSQIAPRLFIGTKGAPIPEGAMMLHPAELPPWLGSQFESKALLEGYSALLFVLREIEMHLRNTPLTGLQVCVLRVLIVHAWRRLTLKHPDLPRAAHSTDWCGHDCRSLITILLTRLKLPTIDEITTT